MIEISWEVFLDLLCQKIRIGRSFENSTNTIGLLLNGQIIQLHLEFHYRHLKTSSLRIQFSLLFHEHVIVTLIGIPFRPRPSTYTPWEHFHQTLVFHPTEIKLVALLWWGQRTNGGLLQLNLPLASTGASRHLEDIRRLCVLERASVRIPTNHDY